MCTSRTISLRTLVPLLLAIGLVGCGEESSTAPEGPAVPSVAGVWTGEFRDSGARMELTQSGSNVSGTVTVGRRAYPSTGTVDAAGTFEWSSELREADCSRLGSPGLQLANEASTLAGTMVRTSTVAPCDSGRRLVERGSVQMTKAF